jgi:hypothetical protein
MISKGMFIISNVLARVGDLPKKPTIENKINIRLSKGETYEWTTWDNRARAPCIAI